MKASLFALASMALTAHAAADCKDPHTKRDVHSHYLPDFYAQALRDAKNNPGPDGMPFIPVRACRT